MKLKVVDGTGLFTFRVNNCHELTSAEVQKLLGQAPEGASVYLECPCELECPRCRCAGFAAFLQAVPLSDEELDLAQDRLDDEETALHFPALKEWLNGYETARLGLPRQPWSSAKYIQVVRRLAKKAPNCDRMVIETAQEYGFLHHPDMLPNQVLQLARHLLARHVENPVRMDLDLEMRSILVGFVMAGMCYRSTLGYPDGFKQLAESLNEAFRRDALGERVELHATMEAPK